MNIHLSLVSENNILHIVVGRSAVFLFRPGKANYAWSRSGPPPGFINKVNLAQSHAPFISALSTAAFTLQGHSGVLVMETTWPAEPKIFTLWPLTEKVGWPLHWTKQRQGI